MLRQLLMGKQEQELVCIWCRVFGLRDGNKPVSKNVVLWLTWSNKLLFFFIHHSAQDDDEEKEEESLGGCLSLLSDNCASHCV